MKKIFEILKQIDEKGILEYISFLNEEKPKEKMFIHKPMIAKTVYPDGYPIKGTENEKFAYYAKNSDLIPLTK